MYSFFADFFSFLLEFIFFYILFCGLFHRPLWKNAVWLLYGLIPVAVNTFVDLLCPSRPVSTLICSLFVVLFFWKMLKAPFFHIVFFYMMELSLSIFLTFILLPIFGLTNSALHSPYFQYVGLGILIMIALFIYYLIPLQSIYEVFSRQSPVIFLILADSFLIIVGIITLAKTDASQFFSYYFVILFFFLALLFINGEVYISYKRSMKRKKQLEAYQKYLPIIENMIQKLREKQHDYTNELQSIHALCYTCHDYESLKTALSNSTEHFLFPDTEALLLKMNLHLVAGFLLSKIISAQNAKKELFVTVTDFYYEPSCSEYELIDYFGILIDNALEAVSAYQTVYIHLSSDHNRIVFDIKNPGPLLTPEYCRKIFSLNYTSKQEKDSHGIGLYKLNKELIRHHGEISLRNETINGILYLCFQIII